MGRLAKGFSTTTRPSEMIAFLYREEIDDDKWNFCIKRSKQSRVYAQSWYLDCVAENWGALVLNDYEAVMPLPYKRKFGIFYVYPPYFTQQLGVFSVGNLDEELIEAFLHKIPKKFKLKELYLNSHNAVPQSWESSQRLNLVLPLSGISYEQLQAGYKKQIHRNIKKAEKAKLSIMRDNNPEGAVQLFQSTKGLELEGLNQADYERLKQVLHAAVYYKQADLWTAYDEKNQPIAAAAFLVYQERVTLILSAATEEAKECGAMSLLIHKVIEESLGYMKTFDFEGSAIPGLKRFYKGFGAVEENYHFIRSSSLPFWIRLFKK